MATSKPDRILIRSANWIGDAIVTTPAIRALRRKFPRTRLALMCRPWVAPIFEHNPDIDEVVCRDDKFLGSGFLPVVRSIRRGRFDLGVLFPNSFGSALALWAGGVKKRVGYATDGRRFLLTDPVPVTAEILKVHMVEYYLNILRDLLDVEKAGKTLVLHAGAKERAEVAIRLSEHGIQPDDRLIGVNPGSTNGTAKRWLPERYAALSGHLTREYGLKVVVTGSPAEAELGEQVARMAREPAVNLAGKLTLAQSIALMERLSLFITNDSGAMHVASAMGVRIVAVFGSTDWIRTPPWSDRALLVRKPIACAPCMLRDCPHEHECMTAIEVSDVLEAVEKQLHAAGMLRSAEGK